MIIVIVIVISLSLSLSLSLPPPPRSISSNITVYIRPAKYINTSGLLLIVSNTNLDIRNGLQDLISTCFNNFRLNRGWPYEGRERTNGELQRETLGCTQHQVWYSRDEGRSVCGHAYPGNQYRYRMRFWFQFRFRFQFRFLFIVRVIPSFSRSWLLYSAMYDLIWYIWFKFPATSFSNCLSDALVI